MSSCDGAASVVCLSVCPCVCKLFCGNRYYDAKNGSIATKLAQDGQHVGAHPGCAQGRGQGQRSRDTGTLVLDIKSLFLAGKWLDCDQTCTRWSHFRASRKVPISRFLKANYSEFFGFVLWSSSIAFFIIRVLIFWNKFINEQKRHFSAAVILCYK